MMFHEENLFVFLLLYQGTTLVVPSPGLTSWAKFSRPCGTEHGTMVLMQTLQPVHKEHNLRGL